ncbi:uncharacterized protein F4807DRAFT_467197 [Annulohypoxylon truncatum]|uniref:uncharacterized protein n=1 Tax=Annulohypoxylon truncatum TaxID=327061 RepID=UPI002007CE56|nr:uncharacterized protein F4807DRAFT_467197 [Annulohypoxylon truncatum]KAI1210475.1 hypothetical protein F4807DRAFT_467197 [Annulohypoxylon truncatum]
MSSAKDRRLKKANEDISSSAESDEVIFQGKKSRQNNQWQYRGRTGSEVTSAEPVSAPVGLGAQQSEGFQRFFKAVVSPTHVRVTAGGRIVPNTRGSASPTAKWDKERSAIAVQDSVETSKEEKHASSNGIGTSFPHPLISPPLTGHPPFFHHMGVPMPMYPFHQGFPMAYGIPPHSVHWAGRQPMPSLSQQDAEEAEKTLKSQDGAGDKKPRPAPIKIAPRSETELNRPFYHNGNVIYPAAYGPGQGPMPMMLTSPYYAPGMGGHPTFASVHAASMGQPSPATPMFSPVASPAVCGPLNSSNAFLQPSPAAVPGFTPHITSIRPSEITRRQLEALRNSLKYYKDQQQFNKHQIDEKWVAQEVQKLEKSVKEFEYNYEMQSKFEAIHYPPQPAPNSGRSSARSRRGPNNSRNSSMSAHSRGRGRGRGSFQSCERGGSLSSNRRKNRQAIGINSNIGMRSPLDRDSEEYIEAIICKKVEAIEKAKEEAKAKEEQLAQQAKSVGLSGNASVAYKPEYGLKPVHTPQSEGPVSQAGVPAAGVSPFDGRGDWNGACAPSMYPNNSVMPTNAQLSPMNIVPGSYSQPYLVGSLPRGVTPHSARATDYIYARPLTEEEKRARSHYWGQFPSAGTGLPKFDGKDFYPPSPVKADGASAQSIIRQPLPSGSLLPETDPFRPSRDVHGARIKETGHRVSKAIPIVAPKDATQSESKAARPYLSAFQREEGIENVQNLSNWMGDMELSSSAKSLEDSASKTKQDKLGRQAFERSSRSGNELWHTMLKRGSTSGAALPSAVSSTTATGYLPQYHGHAAASLGPTISNTNGSTTQASPEGSKTADRASSHLSAEKVGENRRPSETRSEEYDPLKDIQERMLRDAERRGVIGSDW